MPLARNEFNAGIRASLPVLVAVAPFGLVTGVAMALQPVAAAEIAPAERHSTAERATTRIEELARLHYAAITAARKLTGARCPAPDTQAQSYQTANRVRP